MSTRYLLKTVTTFPRQLFLILVYLLTLQWLTDLIALIRESLEIKRREKYLRDVRRGRPLRCSPRCAVIRPEVYKRADPLIYSQSYLMEQGLAVTWNNPDIQLFDKGVPVSSSLLKADTDYEIVATVYNNSTDAPAVGMEVEFAFQSFGVGSALTPIGTTTINLPVKGAPGHPALAKTTWHTPTTPGHYCLKVRLVWDDDANPKNNLGQENTDIGMASSPAMFHFPVRNDDTIRKAIHMTADAYVIPAHMKCLERPKKKDSDRHYPRHRWQNVFVPTTEESADWTLARVRHSMDAFPIPTGWSVDIRPGQFVLAPGETQDVTVAITPPDDFRGERSFNVNAMHGTGLLGGVTLIVTNALQKSTEDF
jgi:glyoxylase-like metal-dependent hydrolase (beta-lactamase superfamily II)